MRTAAIIITYHPDMALLHENVKAVADSVDALILWRNSPSDLSAIQQEFPVVTLMGDGQNRFIAHALNIALAYCAEHGCNRLLTLDQDSVFPDFSAFLAACDADGEQDLTAIYAPFFKEDKRLDQSLPVICADWVITSGSLVNVAAALRLGGFREDYEIDAVDFEYCCWARQNGYRIKVLSAFALRHKLGYFSQTKWGFRAYNYAPVRYFHMIRNQAWLLREYAGKENLRIPYSRKGILSEWYCCVRGIAVAEKQKWPKLLAATRGLVAGFLGKIPGRRPTPLVSH